MTVVYFGEKWDAPVVDDATQVATPVGQRCYECDEPVVEGDRGLLLPTIEPVHAECALRSVMGHIVGVCTCTGYGRDRAAAREVWRRVFGTRS